MPSGFPPGSPATSDSAVLTLLPSLEPRGGEKLIGTMPLVPIGRLNEANASVHRADVEGGAVRLVPLSDVSLPDVAVPVDGLYPDQEGYPYFAGVSLHLAGSSRELQEWFQRLPSPAGTARTTAKVTWIGAVGDVMPARGVDEALLARGGIERVFTDTLPWLRSCSFLLANLESSTATGGAPLRKAYTFRFRPDAVGRLKEAGFSYLSLTNNHTFDFGPAGFLETLASLSRWGILTSGAGENLAQASLPSIVKVGDLEVRLLSFGAYPVEVTGFDGRKIARAGPSKPGILWLDEEGLDAASRAFSSDALNIAVVHGGQEWSGTPTAEQRRLYRELIRHGANVVIGAHPHVLQEIETFHGGLIAYSLGNFLFPGMEDTPGGQDSVLLRLGVYNGNVRFVQSIRVRLEGGTVRLLSAGAPGRGSE